jgi:hypothetical protein
MSIRQAQRGAVHIMFLITALVVALVFAAMWFSQLQDNEAVKNEADAARREIEPLRRQLDFAKKFYAEAATLHGGGMPTEIAIPEGVAQGEPILVSDPAILGRVKTKYVSDMREQCRAAGDPASAPNTAREAMDVLSAKIVSLTNELSIRDQQITTLRAETAQKTQEIAAANTRRDTDVAAVNTEKDNAVARLSSQLNDASAERDALQTKNREKEEEVQKTRVEKNDAVKAAAERVNQADNTVGSFKANERLARETKTPDGKILAVNASMRTAWIDVGSKQFLRRGTAFEVYETVKGSDKIKKGRVVVTSVDADRAEVRIDSEEPGRKITEGDWIFNAYFERGRTVRFTFLGAVNGTVSKELATRILEGNGAAVDEAVTAATDFLVLGVKETPESEELTESQIYKDAVRWGVEIIRASDLETFLKP